ncbi:hypothetical protein LX15_001908 [Streptoalloteichus tenebrarius]|uniref:Uncharacterized protein n=1 Tax=Streptoalloteichus tenebrarius (strain ATCC 17920 / DSM 40477 / JCM 4838 / CBS 697.72 / NBRC 16177 / NCIMB 11028 / NRRL B-12390 / A12253. 1 / ISP 5477) TaxID=1933 RepID=A0ABT1HRS2_STRSD|nr:hypothetical protein [Streptoalloteichus tenebrarius]MCP2258214.1 hypothetical protein [Streptoalloteichus tenebrarius]BFF04557.1 hypothetical protein GCM10020241_62320 [Streptoalloteichus tenebrarius]
MSFNNFARKVRDPSLPYGRRVSALGSCVQLYRPIGFHATFSFLRERAGQIRQDERALLRALEMVEASRALWHAEIARYAAARRAAKRQGRRRPHLSDHPYRPTRWYGAAREAAVHALRFWLRHRVPALLVPDDEDARELDQCVREVLACDGLLTSAQRRQLTVRVDTLRRRLLPADAHSLIRDANTRDLLTVARLIDMVIHADADEGR